MSATTDQPVEEPITAELVAAEDATPPVDDPPPAGEPPPAEPPADPDTPTGEPEPAGEPDDNPPADDEPETPAAPPEPEGIGAADIEALERELNRHWKAVAKVMGADFDMFVECPACAEIGTPLAGRIPIGAMAPPPPYGKREDTEACATCEGYGLMFTGSKVAGQELLPCPRCTGAGYTTVPIPYAPAETPAATEQQTENPRVAELQQQGYIVIPPVRAA